MSAKKTEVETPKTEEKLTTVTLKGPAVINGLVHRKGDKLEVTAEKAEELKELKLA